MGFPLLQKSVEMCLGRQIGVPAKFWNFNRDRMRDETLLKCTVRTGQLSEVNLDPDALADMVSIMVNKLAYKPSVKDIMDKYYEMFPDKNQS